MNEKDRKFILKIAESLKKLEDRLSVLEGRSKIPAIIPPTKSLVGSGAANKFFGVPVKPQNNIDIEFKEEDSSPEVRAEVENGVKMLNKAIVEFCEEFQIKSFSISYSDSSPSKKQKKL